MGCIVFRCNEKANLYGIWKHQIRMRIQQKRSIRSDWSDWEFSLPSSPLPFSSSSAAPRRRSVLRKEGFLRCHLVFVDCWLRRRALRCGRAAFCASRRDTTILKQQYLTKFLLICIFFLESLRIIFQEQRGAQLIKLIKTPIPRKFYDP